MREYLSSFLVFFKSWLSIKHLEEHLVRFYETHPASLCVRVCVNWHLRRPWYEPRLQNSWHSVCYKHTPEHIRWPSVENSTTSTNKTLYPSDKSDSCCQNYNLCPLSPIRLLQKHQIWCSSNYMHDIFQNPVFLHNLMSHYKIKEETMTLLTLKFCSPLHDGASLNFPHKLFLLWSCVGVTKCKWSVRWLISVYDWF